MARYIDADILLEELQRVSDKEGVKADTMANAGVYGASVKYGHGQYCYINAMEIVKDAPTADVVEVKRGKWKIKFLYARGWDDWITCECTFCGWKSGELLNEPPYKHCPNCGARMDGDT